MLKAGAYGDIFGSITEGLTAEQIKQKFGNYVPFPQNGRYTDDTEMTIALAEYLLENDIIDRDNVHRKYADKMTDRGYSSSTRKILTSIKDGNFPEPGNSIHNGAVMRISPLSFLYLNDEELIWACKELLYYTHLSEEAVYSAFVHCRTLQMLRSGNAHNMVKLYNSILNNSKYCNALFTKLNLVKMCLLMKDDVNITEELTGNKDSFQIRAIDCLACSYYIFFRYNHQPELAVYKAVTMGGDTDTIAKIVGEMLGAYKKDCLPNRNIEDRDYLDELEERLYKKYN